jgi:hypothetical protein
MILYVIVYSSIAQIILKIGFVFCHDFSKTIEVSRILIPAFIDSKLQIPNLLTIIQ